MVSDPPKVFISYSHDSPEYEQRILQLAERLRSDGVDAQIDQYVSGVPEEGWPRWMLNQLDWAEFVLVVCTDTYYRRFRGLEEPGKGKGANWEGNLITIESYNKKSRTTKFVPVFFNPNDEKFIPEPLGGQNRYVLDSDRNYDNLYAFLVGQAGVSPGEVGRLKTLARKQVEPLIFPGADTTTRCPIHNLPFPPNPAFIGRDMELEKLREQLQKRGDVAVTQIVAVHGLRGVGKTQLVLEYAWKNLRSYEAVLWVKADSSEVLDATLAALASVFKLQEAGEREQAIQIKAVLNWLHEHRCWLLIVADADTESVVEVVRERLQPNLPGAILITSGLSRWPLEIPHLLLDVLPPDDAARYLLDRVAKQGHYAGGESAAKALACKLGNLPIALEHAASFIAEVRWSFDKYGEEFTDSRADLQIPVGNIWRGTLDRLSPLARALLRITAWFAADVIPREILSADIRVFSEALGENVRISEVAIDRALGELDRFSLIRLTNETVSVHRLLQCIEQDSLGEEERQRWMTWAARLFNAFAPPEPEDVRTWRVWLPLSVHAETLIEHSKRCHVEALPIALVANQFGVFLNARAAYAQAKPLLKRALAIREKVLDREHPDVATSLNDLAELYDNQGQYAKAEPLYQRALGIREKALEPEHADVATSLNNLAGLYRSQGQYAEAGPLYMRALAIREKALGPEHPAVADSLHGLALLYAAQGRYAKAEPLYQRALAIREKALGPEHPDVAVILNNLARLYHNQRQYTKAELLYERALAIQEKALVPGHPDLAWTLNDLAKLCRNQGQYVKAELLYGRALAIREALDPEHEHPDLAWTLNDLAKLLRTRHQYAEAEPLYQRALAIREKTLGPEHRDLEWSLTGLARLYADQGQYAKAEPLYRRGLAIREKALGPEQANVAWSLTGLASLCRSQGQYTEAEPFYQRALAILEKALGPEHPNVANCLNNLAELYKTKGQYAEAEPLYQRALGIREKALGPEHPDVANSLNNLALLRYTQGQYTKAELLYQRALAICEKARSEEATCLENYALCLRALDRSQEAEPLEARARAIRVKRSA